MNRKSKVALCLHGIAKGKNFKHGGLDVNFESESELYTNNFILPNNADVFIHSWSTSYENEVNTLYKPVSSLYENPMIFNKPKFIDYIKDIVTLIKNKPRELNRINNIYSRWYSLYKVIELVREQELIQGFKYDYVMVTRFDMSLLSLIECSKLENGKFYTADWVGGRDEKGNIIPENLLHNNKKVNFTYKKGFPTDDEGILDFWFISSSELISKFSEIHFELESLMIGNGMSNHKIALQKLKNLGLLDNVEWTFKSGVDFCLTRWMNP